MIQFENTGLNNGEVTITANAEASTENTNKCQFLRDGELVGSDSIPPFLAKWEPQRPGFTTLYAEAIDDRGNKFARS